MSESLRYATFGHQKTMLIVGLGNPGPQYEGTRHNIGFAIVDAFAAANEELSPWIDKKTLKCQESSGNLGDTRVILVKPTTFMNLGGDAVQAAAHFYKVYPKHTVAVYDELDIPFGQIRTRFGGSSAGHNGIKSVITHIGEDFGRVRIGVGPKQPEQMDSADFVLAKFTPDQQLQLKNLTNEAVAILTEFVYGGQLPHETRSFIV